MVAATRWSRVAEVDAVLLTRDLATGFVSQRSLKVDTIDSSEATHSPVSSLGADCSAVGNIASEQTSCCGVQRPTNPSSLETDSVTGSCRTSTRVPTTSQCA